MYNKYNAKKVVIDGIKFDSQLEAKTYRDLRLLQAGKKIKNLSTQPKFLVINKFVTKCDFTKSGKTTHSDAYYTPDFRYETMDNKIVIVEVKGMKTEAYQLRKKLFLSIAQTGVFEFDEFHEVTAKETKKFKVK